MVWGEVCNGSWMELIAYQPMATQPPYPRVVLVPPGGILRINFYYAFYYKFTLLIRILFFLLFMMVGLVGECRSRDRSFSCSLARD